MFKLTLIRGKKSGLPDPNMLFIGVPYLEDDMYKRVFIFTLIYYGFKIEIFKHMLIKETGICISCLREFKRFGKPDFNR